MRFHHQRVEYFAGRGPIFPLVLPSCLGSYTMGVSRDASLDLMEEGSVKVGDYVLLHIGFIMNKIDEVDALSSLEAFKEVMKIMDEEELERTIIESEKVNGETREATLGCSCPT